MIKMTRKCLRQNVKHELRLGHYFLNITSHPLPARKIAACRADLPMADEGQ